MINVRVFVQRGKHFLEVRHSKSSFDSSTIVILPNINPMTKTQNKCRNSKTERNPSKTQDPRQTTPELLIGQIKKRLFP